MALVKPDPVRSVQCPGLSRLANLLLEALQQTARAVAESRGYHHKVSQVHFFCPGEIVAHACGMARSTLYRKLAELKALGLVDARAHYVTLRGATRADGMVFAVRVRGDASKAVKVPYDALKTSYRSLSADIDSGRTAWAQLKKDSQEKTPKGVVNLKLLLDWAVKKSSTNPPLVNDCPTPKRPDLEAVLDVPHVEKADQAQVVDVAARALASALNDLHSLGYYRSVLWRLLRRCESTGESYFYPVYLAAQRTQADVKEGWARKGGAVFANRVKTIHEGFLMCRQ